MPKIRVVIGKRKGAKVRCRELTGFGWVSHTYNSVSEARRNNPKSHGKRAVCKRLKDGKIVLRR